MYHANQHIRQLGIESAFLRPWNLVEELASAQQEEHLELAEYSQPLCTAVQLALVDLLDHWGIRPSAVVGHSSGEIAAAYCAGHVVQTHLQRLTTGQAIVACWNSPKACTFSGDVSAIDELFEKL